MITLMLGNLKLILINIKFISIDFEQNFLYITTLEKSQQLMLELRNSHFFEN
jgi:hypothetical protein